jgi:hypothetical protein
MYRRGKLEGRVARWQDGKINELNGYLRKSGEICNIFKVLT